MTITVEKQTKDLGNMKEQSIELPAGYKLTELGVIPDDWEEKCLGDIASIATGNTPPTHNQANYGSEYLFVSPADITEEKFIVTTFKKLSKAGYAISRKFPRGSVLFTCIGSTIGKCSIASIELTSNQQINAVLPSPNFSYQYLYYSLCAAELKIRSLAGKQAVPIVNKSLFSKTILAIPSLSEQRVIAAALSDIDSLITNLNQLIAKKQNIKQATMQRLLTGKERLPGFNGEWQLRRIGEVFQFLSTANNPRSDLSDHGEIGYIHYGDIHGGTSPFLDSSKKTMPYIELQKIKNLPFLEEGDLVIADASEDYEGIGKSVEILNINNKKIVAGLHTFLLRGNKNIVADRFKGYIQFIPSLRTDIVRLATGISVYGISKNNLRGVEVKLPPLKEQAAIANLLSDMDTEITALEQQLDKTRNIKQAMMQELLTGRIRLV